MKKPHNKQQTPIAFSRSSEIEVPSLEPSNYRLVGLRDWERLRRLVENISEKSTLWDTLFNISTTAFFTFLLPAVTTPESSTGWKTAYLVATFSSLVAAVLSHFAKKTEKSVVQSTKSEVIELIDEVNSFFNSTANNETTVSSSQPLANVSFDEGPFKDERLYDDVVVFAKETGNISTSKIQRQFRVGYGRAARIMEQLEINGIVGERDGAKARSVID